jgi:hypothetical protein
MAGRIFSPAHRPAIAAQPFPFRLTKETEACDVADRRADVARFLRDAAAAEGLEYEPLAKIGMAHVFEALIADMETLGAMLRERIFADKVIEPPQRTATPTR